MKFDLHRLQLLRELKYRGTLTAVAAALSYSPSAVSQQLSLLENDIGARLLEPDGRRLRLTAQARILVAHTEAVLQRLEQAEADIARSLDEVAGTVRIAAFQTAMLMVVPPALSWLRLRHPDLRVEITQAEPEVALSALLPRDFDLVIDEVYPGYPQTISAGMDQKVLIEEPVRLAACAEAAEGGQPGEVPELGAYATAPCV
ncbi:MAG: LysR family transcriptional regulator, partial [Trebonia sp.]